MNQITNLELNFEDKAIGNLHITPDWVKWLLKSPVDELKVTVIEFSLTALSILARMRYERLDPADPILNEVVSFYKYYEGSLMIGKGRVIKISEKVIEFTKSFDTEENCCGF